MSSAATSEGIGWKHDPQWHAYLNLVGCIVCFEQRRPRINYYGQYREFYGIDSVAPSMYPAFEYTFLNACVGNFIRRKRL